MDDDMTMVQPEIEAVIGEKQVTEAVEILQKYKEGKSNLEERVKTNEEWYRLRHWEQMRTAKDNTDFVEPASAWLFNAIANKHADAMDNFPEPVVLPREQRDQKDAEVISSILPVILQRNGFEQTYDNAWWDKLKSGTAIYGVFWDNSLENGLGDINDKQIDIMNIFWQPGISDIQKSRNIFTVELVDNDNLKTRYPQLANKLSSPTISVTEYNYDDTVDNSERSVVVDWYYKKVVTDEFGAVREVLHYCKFCNGVVLYATENDPKLRESGWYNHGQYPFVFDVLFPEKGTPCGFGYVDIAKDPQKYIDKLDQLILVNADETGSPRYFVHDKLGMNEAEFLDKKKKIIHFEGAINETNLKPFDTKPLDNFIIQHHQNKIEELKETSGNMDFSQGTTTAGVTAASAIAALQEAGSKLSRDPIKASYRSFEKINILHIELIRQFYTEPREFRITGKTGGMDYIKYTNTNIMKQSLGIGLDGKPLGFREPIFDINVKAQKSSPFSTVAHNELAKELFKLGVFNPQYAQQSLMLLEMMRFEGKDALIQKVQQNFQLYQVLPMLLPVAMQMDAMNMANGSQTNIAQIIASALGMELPMQQVQSNTVTHTNPLGKAVQTSKNSTATTAQEKAQNVAAPR